ncbi:hypothetical protein F5972_08605 [Microbispora cellulosiformans]|uniref:Uncharacterized protein n=1 Tax=Microbispora cellulosiformans TaxID=2614688 RepID=A0A5J5K524_9ACTN|nr:hypothetical protein [Microbispora cellulosiformans]KAA9379701.1 hypothetical protein F5972_08605 [Microbispora cellulosiformans]
MSRRPGTQPATPAPLTPAEREEAERAIRDAIARRVGALHQQLEDLLGQWRRLEGRRRAFEEYRALDDQFGLALLSDLTGTAVGAGQDAAFRGGDQDAYRAARRAELLVGRYLRETGNEFMQEYGDEQ